MLKSIPFEIPAELLARYGTGELVRFGSLLKDVGTGKIVAHLQETGLAQSLLSTAISGVASPLSLVSDLVNMGSNIYVGVQVHQMKMLMLTLQSFQVATLGVSLVGVGISAAGFIYMRKRFNALDSQVSQLIDSVQSGFEEQRMASLRHQLSIFKGLVQRVGQAHALSNPQPEYADVTARLMDQSSYFEGEIRHLLSKNDCVRLDLFWQLSQALILCDSTRIECRMRTNELSSAIHMAETVAAEYQGLFNQVTPISFNVSATDGLAAVRVLRDATDAAASKPYLIDYLHVNRISGQDYVQALEREKEQPLLVLNMR